MKIRSVAVIAAISSLFISSPAEPLVAQARSFSLDGLVITASPTARSEEAVANHVTVLSGDQLRAAGGRSLSDALRNVPGVGVVRGGSFGALTSVFLPWW